MCQVRLLADGNVCRTSRQAQRLIDAMTPTQRVEFDAMLMSLAARHAQQQPRAACAHQKETAMSVPNAYDSHLDVIRTPEQRRALEARDVAYAVIEQQAADASAENEERFRAMADARADLAAYTAPDGYSIALKAAQR